MPTMHEPRETSFEPAITILVADDFDDWRAKIREMVQADTKWQVIGEASDGEQAVQLATTLRPDVVLLDIGMPYLSGIEAAKQIRKAAPQSRVIFLTQYPDIDMVNEARTLGADGYVLKNQAASELIPAIATALYATQNAFTDESAVQL
jgi:DNA-binding NarL/FixJ family response regulator